MTQSIDGFSDRARALAAEVETTQVQGETAQASIALKRGMELAKARLEDGDRAAFAWYGGFALGLCTVHGQLGEHDRLVRGAAELWRLARRHGSAIGEVHASAVLLRAHLASGNAATAVQHASALPDALERACAASPEEGHGAILPPLDLESLMSLLEGAVVSLYYEMADYKRCGEVCQVLLRLSPDNPAAAALLAFSLSREGDHEAAIEAYPRAIELNPQWPGLYNTLTYSLAELGRHQEALESQNLAIELAPQKALYWFTRGQLHQVLGDHDAAIADFDHVQEVVGETLGSSAAPEQPTTTFRYDRDVPAKDLADFAALRRLMSMREIGPVDHVLADGRALLSSADQVTTQAVHRILGEALRNVRRVEEAADEYRKAVAAGDERSETRLALCEVLLESGRIEEAVAGLDDLADPADPHHSPARARVILQEIVGRFPNHARARRALGHAECASGSPAQAVATLTQAIDDDPEDAWALLWRGIAQVTSSEAAAEAGWNDRFGLANVRGALVDLAQAALLPGEHQERARRSLGWLLERAMWIPIVRDELLDDVLGDPDTARLIVTALPGLEEPFNEMRESHIRDNPARRWADGIARLARARTMLDSLGLHLLTALADGMRADFLIRLYQVQEALDLLAKIEVQLMHFGSSPHQTAADHAEYISQALSEGREPRHFPPEHRQLGYKAMDSMLDGMQRLRADADARLGNIPRALDGKHLSEDPAQRIFDVFQRAAFLRDAGQTDESLELLQSVPEMPPSTDLWARQTNLVVTVLLRADRLDEAEAIARAALAQLPETFVYERYGMKTNLASIRLQQNDPAEALELLEGMEHEAETNPRQRQLWHVVRAQALAAMDEHALALEEFRTALTFAEVFRKTLRGLEARISFQAQQLEIYEQALNAALGAGDAVALFELLERSKARTFLDQLDSGRVELGGEAERQRRQYLDQARARRTVLRQLATSTDPAAEVELLRSYAHLGGRFTSNKAAEEVDEEARPVTASTVTRVLADAEGAVLRLERRYEDALEVSHEAAGGTVLGLYEVVSHLQHRGEERTLLVEYLVIGSSILILFLRSDGHLDAAPVEIAKSELIELADALSAEPLAGASRPVAANVLERLSPLVEPILRCSRPGEVLCLVPHGILHGIPLHAIPVHGVPLMRTHPVCYTPSATVLQRCWETRERRTAAHRREHRWRSALVFGDSRGDLLHSRFEAATVAHLFGAQPVVGADAKSSELREHLVQGPGPDVVHLACHGRFDSKRALNSGILLAPETGQSLEDAVLTAEEIMRLSIDTDLVILSACSSGRSEQRPGDELIGLARALMQAGAPTVLVSLWPVDDLSTSLLMEGFYRRAADRQHPMTLADALQQAQIEVADMAADAVVAYCDARLAQAEGPERLLLRLDRADAQILAGDLGAAVVTYHTLIDEAAGSASAAAEHIAATAARQLPLLKLRAEVPSRIDYTVRPFTDPHRWASFILIGDWR
jgi:CHAT domain-containing protein/tetratricopeptide (TPR) repeat protein